MSEAIDLKLLRCPVTRSELRREGDWLVAEVGGRRYPIRGGIAVLLSEAAENPTDPNPRADASVEASSGPPQQQTASP